MPGVDCQARWPAAKKIYTETHAITHLGKAFLVQGVHHDNFAVENGRAAGTAETARARPMQGRSPASLVFQHLAARDVGTGKARMHG